MPVMGRCALCVPLDSVFGMDLAIEHCYGASDRVVPGVLGGFRCSCPCRNWPRPRREAR